jgi:GTP pyrophosphokinase
VTGSRPPPTVLAERFDAALAYALDAHRHDVRKVSNVPYVAHLLGVCAIVLENGGDEVEAAAALLHDVAEDHGGYQALAEVERRCGADVRAIVAACSDSFEPEGARKPSWLARKQQYIARLGGVADAPEGRSVLLVSAADKLYNLRSIRDDGLRPEFAGDRVYARFKAGKWGSLWYYRALADIYVRFDGRHRYIAGELERLADRLAEGRSAAELLELYAG